MWQTRFRKFVISFAVVFFILSVFAQLPQTAYAPSPFTTLAAFGNWSWDSANKIMTIVANATANAGDTEANAYGFQDIVNAIGLRSWADAFYNRSYSGTEFEFDFRIELGTTATTWFVDTNKQVTFTSTAVSANWQITFWVRSYGHARFGVLEDATERTTSKGVSFIVLDNYDLRTIFYGNYMYFYSCSFSAPFRDPYTSFWGVYSTGVVNVYNTAFIDGVCIRILSPSYGQIYNIQIQKVDIDPIVNPSYVYADTIRVTDSNGIFGTGSTYLVNLTNVYGRGNTRMAYFYDWVVNGYLINPDLDNYGIVWAGTSTSELYRQYTFNLVATYPNGTVFPNVDITLSNSVEGVVYEGTTDENGQIPQQILTMGFYNQTGGDTIYDYNPYWLNASSADGTYTYYKSWTMDSSAKWEIALLPVTTDNNTAKWLLIGSILSTPIMLALALHQRKHRKP